MDNRYYELQTEACNACRDEHYRKKALLSEQVQRLAQQQGYIEQGFKSGVCAADGWTLAGHPLRALTLLTDLLKKIPSSVDPKDVWGARRRAFDISLCWNPQLKVLQRRLAELKKMADDNTRLSQSDVHHFSGNLLQAQGRYSEALKQWELAWTKHDENSYAKFQKAEYAIIVNLHLGDFAAARRWCELLGQTNIGMASSRVAWHVSQVHLTLWQQYTEESEEQACTAEEEAEGLQEPDCQQEAMAIRVRALLLQTNLGDPIAPRHPARYRLAQRLHGKPEVEMVYERRLLLVDYRLAAVRYVVGMQPVDDFWYTRPQTLPDTMPTLDRYDFQKRVFHTRRALRRAMVQAEYLDECWECTWRQEEIRGREARLDEIVRVVQ